MTRTFAFFTCIRFAYEGTISDGGQISRTNGCHRNSSMRTLKKAKPLFPCRIRLWIISPHIHLMDPNSTGQNYDHRPVSPLHPYRQPPRLGLHSSEDMGAKQVWARL